MYVACQADTLSYTRLDIKGNVLTQFCILLNSSSTLPRWMHVVKICDNTMLSYIAFHS